MKKITNHLFFTFALLLATNLIVPALSHAAVPKLLTYQGMLKDNVGAYVNGSKTMTFTIYDDLGTPLWDETHTVSVSSGLFSVDLGSVDPVGDPLNLDFKEQYFLGVQVAGDPEMTPRVKLTSSGYAITAGEAENVLSGTAHENLNHRDIEGVKTNTINIAKTNFKVQALNSAQAYSLSDMIIDAFTDESGIDTAASSGYTHRSVTDDIVAVSGGGGGPDVDTKLLVHFNTEFTDATNVHTVAGQNSASISSADPELGVGSALLDGSSDYVDISDSADWEFSGDFTIEYFIKFTTDPGTGKYGHITQAESKSKKWEIYTDNNLLYFRVKTSTSAPIISFWGGWDPDTQWHHIALVRRNNDFEMFVDGVSIATENDASSMPPINADIWFGKRTDDAGTTGYYFGGNVDELRISHTARSIADSGGYIFTVPTTEYGSSGGGSGTGIVESNTYTQAVEPSEILLIAEEYLGSTGTISYKVSCDGGAGFTSVTNGALTPLTCQSGHKDVRWQATITGDAELDSLALAL